MPDILDDLRDLKKQATTDRSHFYVATIVDRASAEIERLRHLQAVTTGLAQALLDLRTNKAEDPRHETR